MGRLILLDTSILIKAQKDSRFAKMLDELADDLVISLITSSELIVGSRDSREKKENKSLANYFQILEINEEISELSYHLIDKYGLKVKMGILDALIAATAMHHKVPLWTLNAKHFKQIEGLKLFEIK